MEKIDDIIDEGKQPWDDNVGVNFVFSAKKKGGKMTNYDASRFSDTETALEDFGDETKILADRHNLTTFHAEGEYNSYEVLKKKYLEVVGEASSGSKPQRTRTSTADEVEEEEIVDDDNIDDIGDEDMISEGDDNDFFGDLEDDED